MLALLLALGTLAKGPLGVAVPLFVILLFLALQRDLVFLKNCLWLRGQRFFCWWRAHGTAWLSYKRGGVFSEANRR